MEEFMLSEVHHSTLMLLPECCVSLVILPYGCIQAWSASLAFHSHLHAWDSRDCSDSPPRGACRPWGCFRSGMSHLLPGVQPGGEMPSHAGVPACLLHRVPAEDPAVPPPASRFLRPTIHTLPPVPSPHPPGGWRCPLAAMQLTHPGAPAPQRLPCAHLLGQAAGHCHPAGGALPGGPGYAVHHPAHSQPACGADED